MFFWIIVSNYKYHKTTSRLKLDNLSCFLLTLARSSETACTTRSVAFFKLFAVCMAWSRVALKLCLEWQNIALLILEANVYNRYRVESDV